MGGTARGALDTGLLEGFAMRVAEAGGLSEGVAMGLDDACGDKGPKSSPNLGNSLARPKEMYQRQIRPQKNTLKKGHCF